MNIQRDVNPENDKKLNKMLDDKFGKKNHTLVKGETVRVAQALVKQAVASRKQFEDTIFNKPQGQKVDKHGDHDQRTHSPTGRAAIARERGGRKPTGKDKKPSGKKPNMRFLGQEMEQAVFQPPKVNLKTSKQAKEFIASQEKLINSSDKKVVESMGHGREAPFHRGNPKGYLLSTGGRRKWPNKMQAAMMKPFAGEKRMANAKRKGLKQSIKSAKKIERRLRNREVGGRVMSAARTLTPAGVAQAGARLGQRLRDRKRKKMVKVAKHGQHDQSSHSPTGRGAAPRATAGTASQAREATQAKPEGPSSPAPSKVKLRSKLQGAMKDVDAVLDTFDRGTRVYRELKEVKDIIQGRLKEHQQKVTKADMSPAQLDESKRLAERLKGRKDIDNPHALARWMVQNKMTKLTIDEARERHEAQRAARRKIDKSIQKGIGHSLEILTNALKLIARQEPDAEISEADDKKLQSIIDEILGVAGYLDTVKEQGHFEKGVTKHESHDQSSHAPKGRGGSAKAPQRKVGDSVKLRPDVLARHARSVPAHAGYTKEQFQWRDTLGNLEGKSGKISRIFPGSKHVNVTFDDGTVIGLDRTELDDDKKKVSKGEPPVPNSQATDRPSFTTPAVAREQKRQRIAPNAKGRGTSTAREPGY